MNETQLDKAEKEFLLKRDEMDDLFYGTYEPLEDFFKKKVTSKFLYTSIKKYSGGRKKINEPC